MAELMHFQPGKTFYDAYQGARGNTLAKLAITGEGEQRKSALADLYGLDPSLASQAQAQIGKNDEQDYADLVQSAKVMYSLKGRPEADMMWQRVAPKFSQKYGVQFNPTPQPSDWDAIEKIVSAAGGTQNQGVQSTFISNGNLNYLTRDGRTVDTGKAVDDSYQPIIDPVTGEVKGYAKRSNRLENTGAGTPPPVTQAAPQTPQGATLEEISATADKMLAGGATPDEVNRWTAQQTNAYYLSKGEPATDFIGYQPPQSAPQQARVNVKPKEAPAGYQYNAAGTLEPIKGGPADPANKEKTVGLGDINTLRDDYTKAIQQPMAVMNAYEKMRQAAEDPSPAGDIALIYAYMKILDPTSVVRETEFATAENAGSVPDSIRNQWNRAISGQRVAINRGDFINQGAKLYIGAKQQYNQVRQQFGGIVQRNGINPADVLVDSHVPISQKFPPKGQVYKPQTDADFAKIPKGGLYIDPDDGLQYRKK